MLLIYWVPSGACNIYVTFLCWGVHMDPMVFNVHSAGVHRPPSLHNSLHSVSSAETEYWEDTLSSCAFVLCAAFICFLNYSSREKDVPYDSLLPTVNLFSLNLCFIVHHFLFSPFSRSLPSVVLYTLCFLPLDLYILYRFLYYFWIYHPLSILLHYSCDLSFPTLYWSFMQNCSYFRNVVINCLFFVH